MPHRTPKERNIHRRRILALDRVMALLVATVIVMQVSGSVASAAVPQVTLDLSPMKTNIGGIVQVTATIDNVSGDFALEDLSSQLALPPGTSQESGPSVIPTVVAVGESVSVNWTVKNNTAGGKVLSVDATGTIDGASFTGSGTSTLEIDAAVPTITVSKPPAYSKTSTPVFQWIGSDPQSAVTYDVESSIDNSAFTPVLTATPQTSGSFPPAAEGQNIRIRVRSTDSVGNVAPWSEVSTTIDVVPPVASLGKPDKSKRGTVRVPVYFSNVGSPVTATFSFANNVGGRLGAATNGQVVTYVNSGSKLAFATLRLIAKDALGREASATETYPVETARTSSGLKFSSVKKSGSGIAVAGKLSKSYRGKVTVTATRIGSKGTKKVTRRATAKKGIFKIRLGVRAGTYKVVASTAKTSRFSATSTSKKLTFK